MPIIRGRGFHSYRDYKKFAVWTCVTIVPCSSISRHAVWCFRRSSGMSKNDNTAQKNSDAFRLPVLDRDFLLGDSMRGVRLQLEYAKAEQRLRAWVVRSTIVV